MASAEDRGGLDLTEMEQMSTGRLEELLLTDFHSSPEEEADMAGLYQAARVLADRESYPSASAERAWKRFQKKYLPFAEARSARYEDGAAPSSDATHGWRLSRLRRWSVRGVLAAAALAVLLLSASLTAGANGYNFRRLLAWWTDEVISIAPGGIVRAEEDEIHIPDESREYADLQEALDACGLTRPVVPRWLPEGFRQVDLVVDAGFPGALFFQAAYQRDEDALIVFVGVYLPQEGEDSGSYGHFQKDEGDPVPYEAGGITHLLSTNAGRPCALWANGPVEVAISGDITMEELTHIIDSVYEGA